jgi:D-alanyl-D-alanine carboxypeptidase
MTGTDRALLRCLGRGSSIKAGFRNVLLQELSAVNATTFAFAAGLALGLSVPPLATAHAEARLLVDVETGKVLSEQNAGALWYPASVTKLMTTYVTLKALQEHRITPDTLFVVSSRAVAQQPSKMGFKTGTRVTVDNALKMMLVHSANDMAIVLAEGVGGSIDGFTDEMNAQAHRLGMSQTNYVNPNGLPDDQQLTSARDLAILARALIRDFPDDDNYWHIPAIRLGRHVYRNTNRLMDTYPGSDGMKTGFICASGYNLVATASRGGRRLIAVVLGARSDSARSEEAAGLFERGFGTSALAWVAPAPTTVEALQPLAGMAPDLREQVCPERGHRRTPEEETAAATSSLGDLPTTDDLMRSPTSRLTSGLTAGVAPVDVYTGPTRPPGWAPPAPAARKKSADSASPKAKSSAAKSGADKSGAAKPKARKPASPSSSADPQ